MTEPFYGADLAAVHEADFAGVADGAARDLVRRLAMAGHRTGTVVDLGCGGGTLAAALVDAGYDVLGIDVSASMIELARANVPRARFIQGSVWVTDLPPAVAVTAIGEVINYTADPRAGAGGLPTLVGRVADALAPGGIFLFDIATPGRGGPGGSTTGFHDRHDYTLLHSKRETTTDDGTPVLERRIVLFTREGDRYRRSDEVHRLQLHPAADITALLATAGFADVATLAAYDDQPLAHGWTAFAATAPGH